MLNKIIEFSIHNKFIVLLFTIAMIAFGFYAVTQIPIGAVPDVTNNQVQVITTSRNLSTQDMEQYVTYPVELEMANLPGVKEIRSISKFGLSVVTIVFEDAMGTHLPRQLIAEKLQAATEKIPQGFGQPFMGPISTGLGEIYQYILDVKPGYKNKYSITELRTIQDWIVKRQLSGIPGVVEVNTWGGYLKQYEVAIQTQKLNALNITVTEVFESLEKNNSIAGGGYIEKSDQSYFIRADGTINSLEDIQNIVVRKDGSNPIYIKDIASVGFGSAPRFGAVTANGEGEKVLGQVMMLKDANSNDVITRVKERVDEIAASLPEGVFINPFLERSELIGKTMFTVSENLLLACLIVIFVVVLLLGNVRSGLVVASVIPLSLLFALGMMYIFEVDANLMSLGAIDFGIIIDGAVIIVEYIAFQFTVKSGDLLALSGNDYAQAKDKIALKGASKMMNSAIFGQLIILIVFIPILSLQGVEGKMFQPMALVFGFALIGAMLLCLTYVPVMTVLVLKPSKKKGLNFSDKLMRFLEKMYAPVIAGALRFKALVLIVAALLLVLAGVIFNQMGSEFVPTLDEGDFVIQPVLKTGTSLGKTIEYTTQIETVLKENFSEVDQVVTRIGAAEVPTDPMSMEESDVIITLKPKNMWVNASSKDELADKFKKALEIIPGMEIEFTQPIEMRFNELITGVRADIAIKIFGEDLSILAKTGDEIKNLIANVEGAADIIVEKIEGLPQMSVVYDRKKIARYGLNIRDVNDLVSMAFAGRVLGQVFEGERRFDLVVRLDEEHRKGLDDLKHLFVDIPNGGKIPLSEIATISYQKGAAKISRDDTRRRMVVGVNVRQRDLQSVVEDIKKIITENIDLPPNYSITYGGQFENLQSASKRLMIAVPVALLLIFIMLYFAFHSIKDALLIFTAIPFSAIGGILLLWWRDMPFSISAGVGFIALFGIAVLNGIVLIEHYKELNDEGYEDVGRLLQQGAKDRLRAILLTAMSAAFGFLPMAISTGAGAEVQRPLATVVVGGLVSSTLLTLVLLPVLYALFNRRNKILRSTNLFLLMLACTPTLLPAQTQAYTLDELIALAEFETPQLQAHQALVDKAEALIGTATNLDKTQFFFGRDENNLAINNRPLSVLGLQQSFALPVVYRANRALKSAEVERAAAQWNLEFSQLKNEIAMLYQTYQSQVAKLAIYKTLDSLHADLPKLAERRQELGEGSELDRLSAITKQKMVAMKMELALVDMEKTRQQLHQFVPTIDTLHLAKEPPERLKIWDYQSDTHPILGKLQSEKAWITAQATYLDKQKLPDFSAQIFNGFNSELVRPGFQVGMHVALFKKQYEAGQEALMLEQKYLDWRTKAVKNTIQTKQRTYELELMQQQKQLEFYEQQALVLAEEIIRNAERALALGEMSHFQYLENLEKAYQIRLEYYDILHAYNAAVIQLNYLTK